MVASVRRHSPQRTTEEHRGTQRESSGARFCGRFCTTPVASCCFGFLQDHISTCIHNSSFWIIWTVRTSKAVHRYSRADLLRILRITARQLAAWERAELVASAETYSFFDFVQIKKVRDLCARKVRPAVIRESLAAMQKQAAGMENPLLEAGSFTTERHRVAFRHEGKVFEPIAGQ